MSHYLSRWPSHLTRRLTQTAATSLTNNRKNYDWVEWRGIDLVEGWLQMDGAALIMSA